MCASHEPFTAGRVQLLEFPETEEDLHTFLITKPQLFKKRLYPLDKSLSSGANVLQPMLLASFPHNSILKFDIYAFTLFTNYRTMVKTLDTFYLPDTELSSGQNYPPFEQLGPGYH